MLLRRSRNLYAYTEARLSKRIGAALAAPTLCRMSIMLSLLLSMLLLFLLRLLLVVLLLLLPLLRLLPAVLSPFSSTLFQILSRSLLNTTLEVLCFAFPFENEERAGAPSSYCLPVLLRYCYDERNKGLDDQRPNRRRKLTLATASD